MVLTTGQTGSQWFCVSSTMDLQTAHPQFEDGSAYRTRWWVGEEESNPVAKHSDIEASLPQSFPHPAAATRRDVLRSTLIPLQLAGDVDD